MKRLQVIKALIASLSLALCANSAGAQTCNSKMKKTTPTNEFTVITQGDDAGSVIHHRTNLVWMLCMKGQQFEMVDDKPTCTGTASEHTWSEALTLGVAENAGTHTWRLPNVNELGSIVELSCYEPAINLKVFPEAGAAEYSLWTSTPSINESESFYGAWSYNLRSGASERASRTFKAKVRLVRYYK